MILRTESNDRTERDGSATQPPSPVEELLAALADVREAGRAYLEARSDAVKSRVRRYVLWGALLVIGLIAGTTALATAAVLAVVGAADGLGIVFGEHYWAGKLVVGVGLILGVGLAGLGLVKRKSRAALSRAVRKYESRRKHG